MPKKKGRRRSAGRPTKWNESVIFRAHEFAKQGLSNQRIWEALGIGETTFEKWCKKYPMLKAAIRDGRNGHRTNSGVEVFRDYVHGRLPEHLQPTWKALMDADLAESPVEQVEALLRDKGKRGRQNLFVHALVHYNFNLSQACRTTNTPKSTFDRWVTTDPHFAEILEQLRWHKGNLYEDALVQKVKEGDTTIIKFVNQTFNADRGYGTKVKVEHSGKVEHDHDHYGFDLDDLLDVKEKKKLLRRMRARSESLALPPGQDPDVIDAEIVGVRKESE